MVHDSLSLRVTDWGLPSVGSTGFDFQSFVLTIWLGTSVCLYLLQHVHQGCIDTREAERTYHSSLSSYKIFILQNLWLILTSV